MPQVVASDKTGLMVEVLNKELEKFVAIKEKFVDEFSLEDFDYIDEVGGFIKIILPQSAICHLPSVPSARDGGVNWSGVAQEIRPGGSSPPQSSLFLAPENLAFAPNKSCWQIAFS